MRTIRRHRFILFLIFILIVVTWILITRNSKIIFDERYGCKFLCGTLSGITHNVILKTGSADSKGIKLRSDDIKGIRTVSVDTKGIETGLVNKKGLTTESNNSKITETEFVSPKGFADGYIDTKGSETGLIDEKELNTESEISKITESGLVSTNKFADGSVDRKGINSKLTLLADFDNETHDKTLACCNNTFCLDNIPPRKTRPRLPGPIHICIPAGEVGVIGEVGPLIKSVVLHAKRADVFFHLLTRGDAVKEIQNLMDDIQNTTVKFMYELMPLNEIYIRQENLKINLTISHHSGVWGMSKAYMYILFKHVKKCIVLDADTVFGTDPAFLWDYFVGHNSQELITMRISHSMNESWQCNSGVMLQDFEKMRKTNFSQFYASAAMQQCPLVQFNSSFRSKCGDQALYFGTYKTNHSYFYRSLRNSWNLENCHAFSNFKFRHYTEKTGIFFGLLHLNCLLNSENKAFEVFVKEGKYGKLNDYLNYLIRTPMANVCSI